MSFFLVPMWVLALFYAGLMVYFGIGFRRLRRASPAPHQHMPLVSVVVVARNETDTIAACLHAILANDYPRFEVIVVDDASDDDTVAVVQQIQDQQAPDKIHIIALSDDGATHYAHQKYAFTRGIQQARGTLVLKTDADTRVAPTWIRTMVGAFDPDTVFVAGPVLTAAPRTGIARMEALEFLGLMATAAGAIGMHTPVLCSGANMGFRKSVFEAMAGYQDIDTTSTGEDYMLMHKMAYPRQGKVRFCLDANAVAHTHPAASYRQVFLQRSRWAAGAAHHTPWPFRVMNLLIFLYFVGLFAGGALVWFIPSLGIPLLVLWGLKAGAEFFLVAPAARYYQRQHLLPYFLPEQVVHIPHIVSAVTYGALRTLRWKGRTVRT